MKSFVTAMFALVLTLMVSGCATIIDSSNKAVKLSTSPAGAHYEVYAGSELVAHGETPNTVTLKSGKGYFEKQVYTVKFTLDGHESKSVVLTPTISGWYWGNILVGGLIGMLVVDPLTGAMYTLPKSVDTTLASADAVSAAQANSLVVANLDGLTAEEKARLIPISAY
ncbi:hypothetical protein ACYPKM_00065 [Pseudomonas aeruginosa]